MTEFDSLKQVEQGGRRNNELTLSNVYSVKEGTFGLEKGIKTYLTTLSVEELGQDIRFYETLSKEKDWPISHIIQREVDDDRVNSIVKKYLLAEGREVKYFPPIIIALLPRNADGDFSPTFTFEPDVTNETRDIIIAKSQFGENEGFKKLASDKKNESLVDGIFFYKTMPILDHNLFCWDLGKIYAIVIDGQHRLEALLRAKAEMPEFANARQDVIFIDVSNTVATNEKKTPIEIFRTVFIDINTNAKSVGLVRRILMDDKDLASLCVQSLIESVSKTGESKPSNSFIPSILVDWDGGSLKHELPYITGVLTLYQMINDELVTDRLQSINDHRDQKKIQNFISLLNGTFFVDNTIKSKGEKSDITTLEDSFRNYLKDKEATREVFAEEVLDEALDSLLFNYDYRILEIAQENFETFFQMPIVEVFATLKPYIEAKKILEDLHAFDHSSTLYKAMLTSKAKLANKVNENLKKVYIDARSKLTDSLNERYYLLFTVVGQKAIFKCLFERIWDNYKHGVTPETVANVVRNFIQEINDALEKFEKNKFFLFGKEELLITESELFEEYDKIYYSFWEGILFEDKRIIYNSQGVRALADVINLILRASEEPSRIQERNIDDQQLRFAEQRTKRLLKKRFSRSEEEYDSIAKLMVKNKKLFLLDRIKAMGLVSGTS